MEKITADFILNTLKEAVENKKADFDANFWITSALKLNLLLADEHNKLAELSQEVANIKLIALTGQEKKNVSEANLRVEADPKYLEYKKQDLKVRRIEEFIKICKRMSSVANGM